MEQYVCPATWKQDTGTSWVLRRCSVYSWAKCNLHCTFTASRQLHCVPSAPMANTCLKADSVATGTLCRCLSLIQPHTHCSHHHVHQCWWKSKSEILINIKGKLHTAQRLFLLKALKFADKSLCCHVNTVIMWVCRWCEVHGLDTGWYHVGQQPLSLTAHF